MKAHATITTLALLVASAIGLHAQGLQYAAKFGGGAVLGKIGDQNSRATMNAAFIVEKPLSKTSELFAEFNYRAYNAVDHEVTKFGQGYIPGWGPNGIIILGPATYQAGYGSVDIRKDNLSGYGLSAGYRQQLMDTDFWWHGGLMLAFMKSQQEVTGTITVVGTPYVEGLNYTPAKSGMRPGVFLGGQFKVAPNFFVETNLTGISYSQVNYLPGAYTGNPPTTETKTKTKFSLDVNIGFRF